MPVASIPNKLRIFGAPMGGYNVTDAARIDIDVTYNGVLLPPAKLSYMYSYIQIPTSGNWRLGAYFYTTSADSGEVYIRLGAKWGGIGESYDVNSAFAGYSAMSVPLVDVIYEATTVITDTFDEGDWVRLRFTRDGTNPLDNKPSYIVMLGIALEEL